MTTFDYPSLLFSLQKQKIPFQPAVPMYGLGFLDPGGMDTDLQPEQTIELPLWLAHALTKKKLGMVLVPNNYSSRSLESLKGDPRSISFSNQPFYFQVGMKCSELLEDEALSQTLLDAFSERYVKISEAAHNMRNVDITDFTTRLSEMEKNRIHFPLKDEAL